MIAKVSTVASVNFSRSSALRKFFISVLFLEFVANCQDSPACSKIIPDSLCVCARLTSAVSTSAFSTSRIFAIVAALKGLLATNKMLSIIDSSLFIGFGRPVFFNNYFGENLFLFNCQDFLFDQFKQRQKGNYNLSFIFCRFYYITKPGLNLFRDHALQAVDFLLDRDCFFNRTFRQIIDLFQAAENF